MDTTSDHWMIVMEVMVTEWPNFCHQLKTRQIFTEQNLVLALFPFCGCNRNSFFTECVRVVTDWRFQNPLGRNRCFTFADRLRSVIDRHSLICSVSMEFRLRTNAFRKLSTKSNFSRLQLLTRHARIKIIEPFIHQLHKMNSIYIFVAVKWK